MTDSYIVSLKKKDKSLLDIAEFNTSDEAFNFADTLEVPLYMLYITYKKREKQNEENPNS